MMVSTVCVGGPDWTKSRTEADSVVTPSLGMGMVRQVRIDDARW